MTPVKSAAAAPQQQEISEISQTKKIKIIENENNLLWQPSEEEKEKSKMTEFMRFVNKQHNLSTWIM